MCTPDPWQRMKVHHTRGESEVASTRTLNVIAFVCEQSVPNLPISAYASDIRRRNASLRPSLRTLGKATNQEQKDRVFCLKAQASMHRKRNKSVNEFDTKLPLRHWSAFGHEAAVTRSRNCPKVTPGTQWGTPKSVVSVSTTGCKISSELG